MAQSVHAAFEFALQHPSITSKWHETSNYIVCLSVENERELTLLLKRIRAYNLRHVLFREPDLGNQITALALEPAPQSAKLCSNYPLTLKKDLHA